MSITRPGLVASQATVDLTFRAARRSKSQGTITMSKRPIWFSGFVVLVSGAFALLMPCSAATRCLPAGLTR